MSIPDEPTLPDPAESPWPSESSRRAGRELLAEAIREDFDEEEPLVTGGTLFGDYVLEKELGRGAFGIVYLARDAGVPRHVALKRMRDGELATDSEIERFRRGAEAAAVLEHPNIVQVFHVNVRAWPPFFTMRYVKGTNLAEALERQRPTEEQAVRWMVQIARAVQHAHDRAVIHLDLKPANILLDDAGTPYVTDFGLARRLEPTGGIGQSDTAGGAPYYMAPEQLTGEANDLTVRTDVYALGAILYELVTGEVPHARLALDEWKAALVSPAPIPSARRVAPKLDPDLSAICARALAKQPQDRYQSALALAEDLEHLRRGERDLLSSRVASPRARLWRWVRRHRFALAALVWTLSLPAVFAFRMRAAYRTEHETLARQEQENASMASIQAVAFRFQLLEYAHRVARIAQQPEVIALAASPTIEAPSQVLLDRARGFDSLFVLTTDGRPRGRTTWKPDEYLQRSFAFRDYFRGAWQLAFRECELQPAHDPAEPQRTAYLARAHASEADGQFELAIAAPLCDARGWVGVIGATIASNKVFGAVRLSDGHPGRIAALLGPRDRERKDIGRPLPEGFTFLVHPGLAPGREYQLEHPEPAKIRSALGVPAASGNLRYVAPLQTSDYVDPLPVPGFSGPWAAAFAPVDASGYVVVVQSPRPRVESFLVHCARIALDLAAPFGAGLALLLVLRARQRSA